VPCPWAVNQRPYLPQGGGSHGHKQAHPTPPLWLQPPESNPGSGPAPSAGGQCSHQLTVQTDHLPQGLNEITTHLGKNDFGMMSQLGRGFVRICGGDRSYQDEHYDHPPKGRLQSSSGIAG